MSIGVKLYTATEERDVSFHQVRRSDGSRIRYKRVAEADGEEVAYADIAKGYSLPSGETVVLTDEDFADLPLPTARVVDVLQFVPAEQIDPIYFAKATTSSRRTTRSSRTCCCATRSTRAAGRAGQGRDPQPRAAGDAAGARRRDRDGDDDLAGRGARGRVSVPRRGRRPAPAGARDGRVAGREHGRRLRPDEYTDDYREALQQVIDAKVEGREVVETPRPSPRPATSST